MSRAFMITSFICIDYHNVKPLMVTHIVQMDR